mmetsp:Transcript_88444/g.234910  ORF Transcript_88444/g.234910 Transcript_88444/m.234910 type:complete len:341 (+) Transcript_88444:813-1835(+)
MHEAEGIEALPPDGPVPLLGHRDALRLRAWLQRHEVTPVVGLANHVVKLSVLEQLEDSRNPLATELLERLEFLLELLQAGRTHRGLVEALDTHLLTLPVVRQLDDALAAPPELLQHLIPSLRQRPHRHVNRIIIESKLFAVLPEVVLDKLVDLIHLQHAIAIKVEADVGVDEVTERLSWNSNDLGEDGPELLQAIDADTVGSPVNLLEALYHGFLEYDSISQQVCNRSDAGACVRAWDHARGARKLKHVGLLLLLQLLLLELRLLQLLVLHQHLLLQRLLRWSLQWLQLLVGWAADHAHGRPAGGRGRLTAHMTLQPHDRLRRPLLWRGGLSNRLLDSHW